MSRVRDGRAADGSIWSTMYSARIATVFTKASASGASVATDCVEVAQTADGGRAARDIKNRAAGTQFYTPAQWSVFVTGIKRGELGA
ncbi:DUF397 domain-containing protein [Streptomyces sp. NPDC058653]|uniref:DUF397 domain-containing protein n=1 Tax=Streptomyces sp. NPDC058653 TaxID=3346576 RepID=UPI00365BDF0F